LLASAALRCWPSRCCTTTCPTAACSAPGVVGGAITALLFSGGRYLLAVHLHRARGTAPTVLGTLILLVGIYYATGVSLPQWALITAVIDERAMKRRAQRAQAGTPGRPAA
jgi:hypothetical protein